MTRENLFATKILDRHLDRQAVVYVRQSTAQQVLEHRESTRLQYALVEKAKQFGWAGERIVVIDDDQGITASSAEGRMGFQKLLAEISLNHVGIVFGIEMSRLARSCKDWHQLLELCALFYTLLADQDGIYDPINYNDRLLLGLKGTMSEAELHILQSRMRQGRWNKARRGELFNHVPTGYILTPNKEIAIDPDEQVQSIVKLGFEKFSEFKTVNRVLQYFSRNNLKMGIRPHFGANRGQLEWHRVNRPTLQNMLTHPLYAGAYRYGHRPVDPRAKVPGRPTTGRRFRKYDECEVLIKDHCPPYISWEEFLVNQKQLSKNRMTAESMGSPRDGDALLAGIIVCGKCGRKMSICYTGNNDIFRYLCQRDYIDYGEDGCQSFKGNVLDELISQQILEVVKPSAIELSLAVYDNFVAEKQRLLKNWDQRKERSQYDVDKAGSHYYSVDPKNRLVARELESRWNQALLEQQRINDDYEKYLASIRKDLSEEEVKTIKSLSAKVPILWRADSTSPADRKEVVRLLVNKVVAKVIDDSEIVEIKICWMGDHFTSHEIVRPVARYQQMRDFEKLLSRIVTLYESGKTTAEIAEILNSDGWRPPKRAKAFNRGIVASILSRKKQVCLRPKSKDGQPLLKKDEWWLDDIARKLAMPMPTVYRWLQRGWVHYRQLSGRQGRIIVWASQEELCRLQKLRHEPRSWPNPFPKELITPAPRNLLNNSLNS